LPFDDPGLPGLFAKIKEASYHEPNYLTPSAKDLIHRMIFPKALERITIPEIKNHPWFSCNLPLYIHKMDNSRAESESQIDSELLEIISQKQEYGIKKENIEAIKANIRKAMSCDYCIAYELLKSKSEKIKRLKQINGIKLIIK